MLTIEEITEKLTPIFETNGVTKAVLFGSCAKGLATENSDIDIVIDTEEYIKGWDFCGIAEHIHESLNRGVDLISRNEIIAGGRIDIEVSKTGRVIYEKI